MAYKAYLNNTELFFDSSVQDESFFLSYAMLDLEAGSAGDFTFRIPPDHPFYDSFHQLVDFVDVFRDDERIFTGRVYSITEETDTQRLISCEGLLALLADSVFRPITFDGTLHNLINEILNSHNSQVNFEKILAPGNITVPNSAVYREYLNYETSASRLRDLVNSFGGYLSVSKETGIPNSIVDVDLVDIGVVDVGDGIRLNLDWVDDFTDGCQQVIELNSNLIKIEKTEVSSDIITALIPVGATLDDGSVVTIESVNNGLDYIVADAAYVNKYGLIFGTERWSDVNVPSILKTKAQNRLNAILAPRLNIELTAADLADAGLESDAFRIGQKITVKSDPHNIDYVQFNCQKQELDLLHPEQNRLTLGEAKPGYVQVNSRSPIDSQVGVLSQMFASRSIVLSEIDTATALISGNEGGYVVLHDSDGDNYPDEILIMDTPDINTAVGIWRFNKNGLGFSSNGYDGPYGLALTMDGRLLTNFANIANWNIDVDPLGHLSIFSDPYDTEFTGCHARTMMLSSPEVTTIGSIEYPAAAFAVDAQLPDAGGNPSTDYYRIFYVDINGNTHTDISYATTFQQTSDRRVKDEIKPLKNPITLKLKPVTFRLKNDPYHKIHHGFIAQDVQEIADEDWGIVQGKDQLSLGYTELIADMVATIQSLNERIEALEKEKQ